MASEAFLASLEQQVGGVPANFGLFKELPVFVGQDVTEEVSRFGKQIQTGPGLRQAQERVLATQVGVLRFAPPNMYWVDHYDHRYIPREEDNVIGVVTEAFHESYKVDLGGNGPALLPTLAFDGATKRNRPALEVGALVYARVLKVHRDMDPELSCQVASGPRKDWMTGQSVYGQLSAGFVFRCSLGLAEALLAPDNVVLAALAGALPFEVAIGANGLVWVDAESRPKIVAIVTAIQRSEALPADQVQPMVDALLREVLK